MAPAAGVGGVVRVRVGWPLGTLAAFVVGYVVAALVGPRGLGAVPPDPEPLRDAESRTHAPGPVRRYEVESAAFASTAGDVPPVAIDGNPPSLLGSRAVVESVERPDLAIVSDPQRVQIEIMPILQYLSMERGGPAAAR